MRNRKSFGQILDTLGAPRRDETPDRVFANPLASAIAPIPLEAASVPGVKNLWDHAFAWMLDRAPEASPDFCDRTTPGPAAPAPAPSDDAETIAAELGLTSASTRDELHRARRRFMWRNHPDRRPEMAPGLANRRVAVANMLIDRALERLKRGGHTR